MAQTQEVGELGRVLSKLSMKAIPTWDASNRNEKTIKSHLKAFENAVGGLGLDKEELARELISSLRGQALTLVENLDDDDRKDYEVHKTQLLEVFHKEKPIQILIQEFYGMNWKKKKQTIRQYATALNLTWKKIAKDQNKEDKTSDAILKNRLMDGISAAEPKFGEWLQFTTSPDTEFKKLAIEAENKYDVFKTTRERVYENEWEEAPSFFNKEKSSEENQPRNQKNQKKEPDRSNENTKRNEIAQRQNNMFQGQRRESYDRDQNENRYRWEPQPQYSGGDLRYQGQHRSNWGQQWNRPRWNPFNRGFNQYQTGPRHYSNPRQYYPENEWNRNNTGRNRLYGFQRRPFGMASSWNQDRRQTGYQNNATQNGNLTHQNNESQRDEERQRQRGTIAQRNQNVNFLETTSKNL